MRSTLNSRPSTQWKGLSSHVTFPPIDGAEPRRREPPRGLGVSLKVHGPSPMARLKPLVSDTNGQTRWGGAGISQSQVWRSVRSMLVEAYTPAVAKG